MSGLFGLFRRTKTPCHHGVPGCNSKNLCPACAWERKVANEAAKCEAVQREREAARERKAADEAARWEAVQREKKARIRDAADRKAIEEAQRLKGAMLLTLEDLRKLTPFGFEDEIANMFRRAGFEVTQTPATNDFGRDAVMWKKGKKFLLECKKYDEAGLSGRPDLQKFHSAMMTDGAYKGYFVSTGGFTKAAIEFAGTVQIAAIDGLKLLQLMQISKPNGSRSDGYQSICLECGCAVQHNLRTPTAVYCDNQHLVQPTLSFDKVIDERADSIVKCDKCGARMRVIKGKHGKFWGCSRYPQCSSSKPFRPKGGKSRRRWTSS